LLHLAALTTGILSDIILSDFTDSDAEGGDQPAVLPMRRPGNRFV